RVGRYKYGELSEAVRQRYLSESSVMTFGSAMRLDEPADLVRRGKNHVGAIPHHASADECGHPSFRPGAAAVDLKTQVALPERMDFAVGGGHAIRITAVVDGVDAMLRAERLEIGVCSAHHSTPRRWRMARLGGPLEECQKIGPLLVVRETLERHGIAGNERLRARKPFVQRIVVPHDA